MKRLALVLVAIALLSALFLTVGSGSSAEAHPMLSLTNPARGLVYDGLQAAGAGPCKGGYQYTVTTHGVTRIQCTDGPSPAPAGVNVATSVAPLSTTAAATTSILCDGDGQSGRRVQVLYVHASDVPDRYAAYVASIRQWIDGVDQMANNSAAQTGGTRHVRWVTDSNCNLQVDDVTVSPTGDDNQANTNNELDALGYNSPDRKYLAFVDANVYCGIGVIAYDDQPGPLNANNYGNMFARVDSGCWSTWAAGHELMHMLGGVQMTAPHTDGTYHCTDGYDNMCNHSGLDLPQPPVCSDVANADLWDCNHDDYFSTNPPANSYLATHWNTANSAFLIAPSPVNTVRVDSILTAKAGKRGTYILTDNFFPGDTVYVQAHVVDQAGASQSGASVVLPVLRPDGTVQCSVKATSDASGNAAGSCKLPRLAPHGSWKAHLNQLTKTGATPDLNDSVQDDTFLVQ